MSAPHPSPIPTAAMLEHLEEKLDHAHHQVRLLAEIMRELAATASPKVRARAHALHAETMLYLARESKR